MLRMHKFLTLLVLVALLLSACQPIVQPSAQAPTSEATVAEFNGIPETPRPDAPTYGLRGPYAVGTREFVIEPESERPLPTTVWYPAVRSAGDAEMIVYNEHYPPMFENHLVAGLAIRNAAPDMAEGPYPLVIFSTGLGVSRLSAIYYTEHLASYGFVVIAPDHAGTTFSDRGNDVPSWPMYVQRPQDVGRTIAFADRLSAAGGELAGVIDTELVAVTGVSSGSITTMAAGGARLDLAKCLDPAFAVECSQIAGHEEELAKLAGLESVPEGLWPAIDDPRVDAIIPIMPDFGLYGMDEAGVASVEIPVLIFGGSADTLNPIDLGAIPIYEHVASEHKALVIFENAFHFVLANACSAYPWMATDQGWGYWFCSDSVWDMQRAHDLLNHFSTAFLLAELKGDPDAAAALAPENVVFPGIRYETTAFAAPPTGDSGAPLTNIAEIEALIEKAMVENEIPGMGTLIESMVGTQ